MAAIAAVGASSRQGLYRFDAGRDLGGVVSLLQVCFMDDLDAQDQRWLADLSSLTSGGSFLSFVLRALPPVYGIFAGYVWYADGQLVGNANVLRLQQSTWVIANVATHPDYRRRGIARRLVEAALDLAGERAGSVVGLQVREDNVGAAKLYRDLGFRRVGAAATYEAAAPVPLAGTRPEDPRLMTWDDGDLAPVRRVLARAGALDGAWPPGPLRQTLNASGFAGRLESWMRGRRRIRLLAETGGGARGVLVAYQESRSGPHALEIAVDPAWRGSVESALIDEALRELGGGVSHPVMAEASTTEVVALEALAPRGFKWKRTLDRMTRRLG